MRLLLDTHVLLWWLHDTSRLRPETRALFSSPESELLWSAASTWELAIKSQLGKLRIGQPLQDFITRILPAQNLVALPIHHAHAARVAALPLIHRDPFDRLLIAQAAIEAIPLLTADSQLAAYGIPCMPA